MPFAGYKDFDDCVNKIMSKKGWPKERAEAYCATIKRTVEGEELEEPCPGSKIKSEGKGKGLGYGKGKGPVGIPKQDSGWEELK